MRIAGIELPGDKIIEISLTKIYGIGRSTARKIAENTGISPYKKVKELNKEEEEKIRKFIENSGYILEDDRRRLIEEHKTKYMSNGSYRGNRYRKKLPVHGRTHSNSKTVRRMPIL